MKKLLLATIMIATVSATAYAMPERGMPGWGGPDPYFSGGMLRGLTRLDLTDSQKGEVARILGSNREAGRQRCDAMRHAMEALQGATKAEVFNEDRVRAAFREVAAAGEEMAVHRARLAAELKGILTSEQKAALEERRIDRKQRRGGGWERGFCPLLEERIDRRSR